MAHNPTEHVQEELHHHAAHAQEAGHSHGHGGGGKWITAAATTAAILAAFAAAGGALATRHLTQSMLIRIRANDDGITIKRSPSSHRCWTQRFIPRS